MPNARPQATRTARSSPLRAGPPRFGNEIVTHFDIDLAEPRIDLLGFEFGGERLHELLVFRAVGKKHFHSVVDPLGDIIAIRHDKGKTSPRKQRSAEEELDL